MKRRHYIWLCSFGLGAAILLAGRQAHSTLGEPANSVASDRKAFSAVQRATATRKGYTVQEFESDANVVREYITRSGIVFAVAWNGLSHPDLTSLLGSYVGEYKQALQIR
jgi:hypothetical protein